VHNRYNEQSILVTLHLRQLPSDAAFAAASFDAGYPFPHFSSKRTCVHNITKTSYNSAVVFNTF